MLLIWGLSLQAGLASWPVSDHITQNITDWRSPVALRPDQVLKTRLVAAVLERVGFTTRIIEREVGAYLRGAPGECHVAILGFDNLRPRPHL